jgi:hypothetical protein
VTTQWNVPDHDRAREQGWDIFEAVGAAAPPTACRPFVLHRVGETNRFVDDFAAWQFVVTQAAVGDELAQRALDFLAERSPLEYETVMNAVLD